MLLSSGAARVVVVALECAVLAGCGRSPVYSHYGAAMPVFPDQCTERVHPGVDFRARVGDPVIAAADGTVVSLRETEAGGGVLLLWHRDFERYTAYAHLAWPDGTPMVGQRVVRGQVIGRVGLFRNSGRTPHVHLELCTTGCEWGHPDCNLDDTEDPLVGAAGCFRPTRHYRPDRLVLTYPVDC